MPKKNLGIRDIARLSGVSVATVSRVINTPEMTSDKVRERVNEIIEQYHYVPNLMARDLFAQTSKSFALFVYDLENPFFVSLVKELHKIAFEHKCTLLICDTETSAEKEMEYFRYCEGIRTKGIIFTEGFSSLHFLEKSTQTIAFLDRGVDTKYPVVRSDNGAGVSMLVDYLYNLNHRLFGFAGYAENTCSCADRCHAFLEALSARGITVSPEYIFYGDMTPNCGVRAMDYFFSLKDRPTAIVCANDQVARGFIARASKMGLCVPQDFSIVGFDGCNPEYFYPQITTIRQDIRKLAENLFDCIFGENEGPGVRVVDVSLVVGDSCRKLEAT